MPNTIIHKRIYSEYGENARVNTEYDQIREERESKNS